jgi:hypothetical protein
MSEEPSAQDTGQTPQRVTCPATKDLAVRLWIVAGLAAAGAIWCFWDAYIAGSYPYAPLSEDINQWMGWAFNHYTPVVLGPIAIVFGVWGWIALNRVLIADEQGIGYKGKTRYAWDDVTKLDASDLAEKKILRLHVKDRNKPLVLDALNLQNFKELVAVVEQNVPDDRQAA